MITIVTMVFRKIKKWFLNRKKNTHTHAEQIRIISNYNHECMHAFTKNKKVFQQFTKEYFEMVPIHEQAPTALSTNTLCNTGPT